MANKRADDLVDAASEYSFPASDPPSYMGGTAVIGPPPEDGAPPHEHVIQELTDPDEAKPAGDDIDERIRRRAYEIWESEGQSGDPEEHWRRAEEQIRGGSPAARAEASEAAPAPPSDDAGKMVEQVRVAMDARNARSKETQVAGATGKKEAVRKTGASKGKPRRPK